jgi:hypothetical protein
VPSARQADHQEDRSPKGHQSNQSPEKQITKGELDMTLLRTCAAGFVVLFVATGCASTEVTQRQYHEGEQLPRPAHILVYDFT